MMEITPHRREHTDGVVRPTIKDERHYENNQTQIH
jgi:hypothetical protein